MKTKITSLTTAAFRLTFLAAALFAGLSQAQEKSVDLQGMVRETQQMHNEAHQLSLVWWIPTEYWQASMAGNARLTPEQVAGFVDTVKPYTVVVVVRGQLGAFGGVTYETDQELRGKLVLMDAGGAQYTPLDDSAVSSDMQNFLAMMKPVFGNMLGAMGKNMDFYLFPANGKDGKPIADAKADGKFTVQLGAETFKWRLPLGSVLPPKICSKCGEKLSGAYKFCPYDGTPLTK